MYISILIFIAIAILLYNHSQQVSVATALTKDIPTSQKQRMLQTESVSMPKEGVLTLLTTKEGIQIRTAHWIAKNPTNGTLLLCQGYSEFLEKYDEVIQHLLDKNFSVVTFDWRGQGLSSRLIKDPQKGHITSFADFVKDADLVYEQIVAKLPAPHHIMGHSMGGHLVFRIIQEYPKRYSKAVLCAPFFGWSPNFGAGKLPYPVVIVLGNLMKCLGLSQSYTYGATPPYLEKTLAGQTSDRVRFQKRIDFYKKEPHILMGGPTWNWILESTKSLQLIVQPERIQQVTIPVLLASGAKDGMVDPKAHHDVAAKLDNITLLDLQDSMHEILMEKDTLQIQFWEAFDRFMGGL